MTVALPAMPFLRQPKPQRSFWQALYSEVVPACMEHVSKHVGFVQMIEPVDFPLLYINIQPEDLGVGYITEFADQSSGGQRLHLYGIQLHIVTARFVNRANHRGTGYAWLQEWTFKRITWNVPDRWPLDDRTVPPFPSSQIKVPCWGHEFQFQGPLFEVTR